MVVSDPTYFVDNETHVFKLFYDTHEEKHGVWKGKVISYNGTYNAQGARHGKLATHISSGQGGNLVVAVGLSLTTTIVNNIGMLHMKLSMMNNDILHSNE